MTESARAAESGVFADPGECVALTVSGAWRECGPAGLDGLDAGPPMTVGRGLGSVVAYEVPRERGQEVGLPVTDDSNNHYGIGRYPSQPPARQPVQQIFDHLACAQAGWKHDKRRQCRSRPVAYRRGAGSRRRPWADTRRAYREAA
ncbi:hypothetical protein [Streptomyces sp. CT34]|uniref:hypothetical protein n=1 Tax=Streptomyces sp. CT34 TaxID=1553907 RepID=UPI0012FE94F4|nr:hypothetical protein [Streptomyces sp. CT34]